MTDATDRDERAPLHREVLKRVTDGIVAVDTDFRCTYVNRQAEQILGTARDELLGQRMWEAVPPLKGTEVQQRMEEALSTQEQRAFERYNSELGRWFEGRVYPDGTGLSMYWIDITARKESQRALEQANRQLRAFVDHTSEAMYLKGREGSYHRVNEAAARLFELDPEEVVGKKDSELFDPESAAAIRTVDEQILEQEEPDVRETVRAIDGEDHVFLDRKSPYRDEEGNVVGILGISRDITQREQHRRKLEQTNTVLATLLENMPIGVLAEDEDREIIAANAALCDVLGLTCSCDDLVGRDCSRAADRMKDRFEDPEAFVEKIDAHHDRREPVLNEEVRLAEGRTLVRSYVPYSHPHGKGSLWLYRDVTERKARTRELERQEFLFERVQEIANLGVWEYDLETDALTWSAGVRRIHGVEPSYEPTLEEAFEFYHPEDRDAITAAVEEAIEHQDMYDLDLRIVRADGATRNVRARGEVVTDPDGETRLLRGVFQDITGRKRREQALQKLTREYETILDNAEDAIFLVDVETGTDSPPTFRYERLNPYHEATSGLTTDEVRGKTPREILGEKHGAEVEDNYRRCVEQREPVSYEEELAMPEGNIVWQTKLAPVIVDGEVTRIVGIARDVTERAVQERKLRRKNERLDEFASVVSHDLRNPLNIALGRTTLAQEELDQEGYESTHLGKVEQALTRMESIIMDTLILARRGKTVTDTEPIPLADLVGRCWEMVDADETTLKMEETCTLRGDRERLRHVFENLFRNAVHHGAENGTVWVGGDDEDVVYVEDDGPGIPADKREVIFEAGHTSNENGTGFGLTIVKRIAEAHGWQVDVTDGRAGGARFEFSGVEVVS